MSVFDSLFGNMFGIPEMKAPLNTAWQDPQGRWWLLLSRVDGFVALFQAIEISGPEDRVAHGKPLCTIIHEPSRQEYQEEQRRAKVQQTQHEFYSRVTKYYWDRGEVKVEDQGFLKNKVNINRWNISVREKTCTCRAVTASYSAPFVENEAYIGAYCDTHQSLISEYLSVSGETWPPKVEDPSEAVKTP